MSTPTPLDDVEFLARSPHRVAVLQTLQSGPWRRPDLSEETGISQPTLGRVLGSLEERHWVERNGREYALTAVGALLVREFDDLLDTVGTLQRLEDVAPLLPTDRLDFDVRRFGSATILTPSAGDVLGHVRRVEEVFNGAERLRILADTIVPRSLEEQHDLVAGSTGEARFVESIITGDALDRAYEDPAMVGWIRDLVTSGRAPVYRYDERIPLTLALADGTVILVPTDEHGFPAAVVESEDEVVRAWVEDELDDFRAASTELTTDDLPQ